MDYALYRRALRKRWRFILFAMIVSILAGGWATIQTDPSYQTTTRFFISGQAASEVNAAISGQVLAQQRVSSYSLLVTSSPVLARVLAVADESVLGETPRIGAAAVGETVVLEITVTGSDPARIQAVANAYDKVFPPLVQRLETPVGGGVAPVKASLIEAAFLPVEPVAPNPTKNLLIAAVLGALVGVSGGLLRELTDTSVKAADELAQITGTVVLGIMSEDATVETEPLTAAVNPRSPRTEAFRQLRTSLRFASVDGALRTLLITSASSSEGKSFISCNLAIVMAQAGERVILVEADLRRPACSRYMGIDGTVGLSDVLVGQARVDDALQPWRGGLLQILPGGRLPPNPSELLGSEAMADLLLELEQRADVVIFDSPPLLPVTDAAVLAGQVDGILVVTRQGGTTRSQAQHALAALARVDARVLGTVLNRAPTRGPDAYRYEYTGESVTVDQPTAQVAVDPNQTPR